MNARVSKTGEMLVEPLTHREREILVLLAQGYSGPEIAQQLTLALSSVKWYVQQVYRKLGVNNKQRAIIRAGELGLLETHSHVAYVHLSPKHNLPSQLTSFIGREKEGTDVKRLLANTHLLTLIGPGGTGKTRLSLQVATEVLHFYPYGVWFVELAPISDPSSIPAAVLAALDLPAEVHRPAIEMLCDYLCEKEVLLILDNCEHLVDACAKMVDRLLHAVPKLRILASSREPLGIAGEVSYRVPSLGLPDIKQLPSLESLNQYEAVRLFIERAVAASPTFAVTKQNAPAVAEICHRLDGIPLALELAAAKVRALSVEQIAKRLDDRFRLLTGGSRTALERHQTLRAALDWSHNLLPEHEQVLFRRLSIFVNGWTLEAAESVCSDERLKSEDIFDLLEQLVNKSLVIAEEWQSETRYRMLETMRQYANEKLIEAGESERLRDRHLEYYLQLAETAAPHLIRPEQLEWLDRLEAEHENMRAAVEWSLGYERPEFALRLTAALGIFWSMHCYWMEGARWLERALVKPIGTMTSSEKIARAQALIQEAVLANRLDNLEKMKASTETSLDLSEKSASPRDVAIAQYHRGRACLRFDEFDEAHVFFEQSLAAFRKLNDPYWAAVAQHALTFILTNKGEKSQGALMQDLELARKIGERLHLAEVLYSRAELAWFNHQLDEAEKYVQESQILYDQIGLRAHIGLLLKAWIMDARNDLQQAKIWYTRTKEQFDLIGEKNVKSTAIGNLAVVARDEGEFQQAWSYLEEALEIAREVGYKEVIGWNLILLGQIELLQGKLEDSRCNFREGLSMVRKYGSYYSKRKSLIFFGNAYAGMQPIAVVQILGMLHAFYLNKLYLPINPLMKRESDSAIAKARQHLGDSAINAAWETGGKMSLNEAFDLALRMVEAP